MKKYFPALIVYTLLSLNVLCQTEGDYRTHQSGNWNVVANWEKYTGGSWVYPASEFPPLAPAYFTKRVTLRNGHTITATGNVLGSSGAVIEIEPGAVLNMGNYSITGFRAFLEPPTRFPNLIINGTLTTSVDVNAINFTIGSSGYYRTSYVGTNGWWTGTLSPDNVNLGGTLEFSGAINQKIPGYTYFNVIVSGSDSKYLSGAVTVSNLLTINSGAILRTNAQFLYLSGQGSLNNGQLFATSGGTVVFNGADQSISGTGSYSFPNLIISSSGATTLNSNISVGILLTISNAFPGTTLDVNGRTVAVNGLGIQIDGIVGDTQGTGSIAMSAGPQNISGTNNNIIISNLRIEGTSSTTLQANISISGLLTVNAGRTLNINGKYLFLNGSGILLNGNLLTGSGAALFFDGGTQTFSGTGSITGIFAGVAVGMNSPSTTTFSMTSTLRTNLLYINNDLFIISPVSRVEVLEGLDIFTDNALVLNSSATSSASLLVTGSYPYYGGNSRMKVERYMTGGKWQIISPSVTDQGIQQFFTNNPDIPSNGNNKGMAPFDESAGQWDSYFTTSSPGFLSAGTGYLTRINSNGTVYFSGTPNLSNTIVPVTHQTYGWNCVGNPFPCSIGITSTALSAQNFLAVNSSKFAPSYGALYIWDEGIPRVSGRNYYKIICNSGFVPPNSITAEINQDYIQSGQGFLVKVNSGASSMDFNVAMQYHNTGMGFFKNTTESWYGIRLNASSGSLSGHTDITFHEGMTNGLDFTYDVGQYKSNENFSIFSRLVEDNGVDFAIQCLPETGDEDWIIPVGLSYEDGGLITFTTEIVQSSDGFSAILEDRELGIFTNLTRPENSYEVPVPPGTSGTGRFFLHTLNSSTGYDMENVPKITTFAVRKEIYIKGRVPENSVAELYDLYGRNVKTVKLEPSDMNSFSVEELKEGIYIIRVKGITEAISNKVFIH